MLEDTEYFDESFLPGDQSQPVKYATHKRSPIVNLEPYPKMFSIGREISRPPLFCASKADTFGAEMGWFRAQGLSVSFCTDPPSHLGALEAKHNNWSMSIVDCDTFGGDEAVLTGLKAVMRSDIEIPFILVSRKNKTSSYWNAQSPRMLTALDDELSIDTFEDALFTILGPDDLSVQDIDALSVS